MAEKKKLNGWYRLWIVYAILPTMFFGGMVFSEGLHSINYKDISVWGVDGKEAEAFKLALKMMDNGAPVNVIQEFFGDNDLKYAEFKEFVNKGMTHKEDRRFFLISLGLGLAFLPLAIGHAIAWIIKGFKE